MKQLFLILSLFILNFSTKAQIKAYSKKIKRTEISDRLAIQNLIDDFAILADKKDVPTQANLFTKDAVVEIISDNKVQRTLKQSELAENWQPFLNSLETLYHFMGQSKITLNGNKASAVSYCMTYLKLV